MAQSLVSIRGVDTLLFRDGRPFDASAGGRAVTLFPPPPSTVAGYIRTRIGPAPGGSWAGISERVHVQGPVLCRNEDAVFSAPADAVVVNVDGKPQVTRRKPIARSETCGSDLPAGMQPLEVSEDGKPSTGYTYWSYADTMEWLSESCEAGFCPERIPGPEMDTQIHLQVSQEGTAEEGMLFSTTMAAFESYTFQARKPAEPRNDAWSLLCHVTSPDLLTMLHGPGRFGGENRIAVIESSGSWPVCPETLRAKLTKATHVRMLLATPAVFEHGWKPAWIDRATGAGSPPGIEGVKLELLSAAVPRRVAISGWDLANKRPKPIRYCAPAGSVYFFRVLEGSRLALLAHEGWLVGVSDIEAGVNAGEQLNNNRNDGFGLALWGTWSAEEQK